MIPKQCILYIKADITPFEYWDVHIENAFRNLNIIFILNLI